MNETLLLRLAVTLINTHAFFILIPSPPSLGNTYGLFPLLVFRVQTARYVDS